MTAYAPPLAEMRFVLHELCGLEGLAALPGLAHASADVVDQVLDEAGRLAAEVIAPLNHPGDRAGARLENGVVTMPEGFKEAYRLFASGGWNALPFPETIGGQGLPWAVGLAVQEMWQGASLAFGLCPLLNQGAIEAVSHHGSDALKARFLAPLVEGRWTGTMCITEPQAGSDVGAVRAKAVRDGERWRISGTKIFLTYGEHDLAENILHLVLARPEGAPSGTRGLSLFLVPKYLPNDDGTLGPRNDLRCVSIEHKLGIHASPTCVMSFGDDEGSVGWLVGEHLGGMGCMFTMMNNARLGVGVQGLAIAERAYQGALAHARERIQGARDSRPARIVEHPDVRRMLLTMRAQIAAMRALVYTTGAKLDRATHDPDDAVRRRARNRVDLLTPVIKAWCTDQGVEIASLALQVFGGMGYIEETGAPQHYRDARISPIYEGTNGIQAMDLVGRKMRLEGGRLPWELIEDLHRDLETLVLEGDQPVALELGRALHTLEEATRYLQGIPEADPDAPGAAATPYLRLMGTTVGAFLLARAALADPDRAALARFYVGQLLPPAVALLPAITAGSRVLEEAMDGVG